MQKVYAVVHVSTLYIDHYLDFYDKRRHKKRTVHVGQSFGSSSKTRTYDPAVNSRMLYRLSYRGI